ncbi:MAG TPA: tetratricopeptide repeat protein [Flavobacteriia bacterium]|nr:tetratricopeptide repeat protein [Flavobacteriia bacterium]
MKPIYLYLFIPLLMTSAMAIADGKVVSISQTPGDSIAIWIKAAKDRNHSQQERIAYLEKAYIQTHNEHNDSLRCTRLLDIAHTYYKLDDSLNFRKVNKEAFELAMTLKDSNNIARSHWYWGNFYSKKRVKDSAYYSYFKAQKIYESVNNNFYSGRMLLNMAIIQSDLKDYTGSEITAIKAISILKPLQKYRQLYGCYNNLGIVLNELGDYNKALYYHNEALKYQQKIKSINTFKANTLNNIGVVYEMQNNYKKAINYYQQALQEKNLKQNNIGLYAMLLDNLAFSTLKLNDTLTAKKLFYKALEIKDSIGDFKSMSINKLHLAQYYLVVKDTGKAVQLISEAKELSAKTHNDRDLLTSLLLLSKLDKKNNYQYSSQYIKLNDSLQKKERSIRNKFARIRFETDEFIDENERLSRQKRLLFLVLGFLALLSGMGFVIKNQITKNKELKFEQLQQNANEEIYNLMLAQQFKFDEGSRKEKKRISQELHDGVLGKLFGTRLILNTLNDKADEESIKKREKYISDLQEIEEEVRNVSHELHNRSLITDVGYVRLIENLLESQCKISNFEYEFSHDDNIVWEEVNGSLKMNLYRILQEAIQNINKYAKATKVAINFKSEDNTIILEIHDNGVGFHKNSKNEGIGLKNMRSRVAKLKGELTLNSSPGKGTSIHISVPYR